MILLTIILVLLFLGVLTIFCAGLWGIFEKAGREGWKALIPGYNLVVLMEIIGLPWWSVFFLLIPIIPWIIVASELGACFKKTKTWSFFLLIPFFFIGIPILGFGEIKFTPPVNIARTERVFNKFLKFSLYVAIIILINIIGVQLFFRFDLTDIGIYSLSKASKQAVATLQEPLTVRAFFSDDLPAEYLDLHQYVEDMFQEYAIYGGKNFNFRFYDVGGEGELTPQEESNREMAQDYGINPVKIQTYKNDTFIYREAYMGMAIIHGDVIETLPQVSSREKLEYNITTTIQKMNNKISALLALEDTIKVKLFLSSDFFGVLTTLTDIPDKVEKIVEELNKENYNKLQYINIDPSKEQLKPEDAALDPKYFLAGTQNDGESIKLYADLIIQYADKIEKYNFLELFRTPWGLQPQLADEDTLKEVINETVTNIININEYIGYIADHGSVRLHWDDMELQALAQTRPNLNVPKLTANIFNSVLSENYTVKEINLSNDERIPKGIECLVIAGPRDKFSDWELFQIDQFLMQGKSLAIFYDALIETEQEANRQLYGYQMPKQYPPADTGLQYLLEHYGASVDSSYVFDENCLVQPHQTYGNLNLYFIPQIQTENINSNL
ncbi:MAG: GldG family protein, partial [Spirochaetales bacterium]|nr:GldG family protein [Spirochaetales bacterium]